MCVDESHGPSLTPGAARRRYWEVERGAPPKEAARPYRIELVGVTCDPGLAVARGVWRKLRSGRSVPIPSQLRSHRLFSENWEGLAHAVDSATLYHTGEALYYTNPKTHLQQALGGPRARGRLRHALPHR